jgi:hypothetical protein
VDDYAHTDDPFSWFAGRGSGSPPPSAPPARVLALLHAQGLKTETWLGLPRRFRYREGTLHEGEWVTVRGQAVQEPDAAGERRSPREPPTVLVLRGSAQAPLVISDDRALH